MSRANYWIYATLKGSPIALRHFLTVEQLRVSPFPSSHAGTLAMAEELRVGPYLWQSGRSALRRAWLTTSLRWPTLRFSIEWLQCRGPVLRVGGAEALQGHWSRRSGEGVSSDVESFVARLAADGVAVKDLACSSPVCPVSSEQGWVAISEES